MGISKNELAKLISVSSSTINDIEANKKNINTSERIKLMELFGLDNAEDLYRKDG